VLAEAVEPDETDELPPGVKMKGPPSFEFVASDGVAEVRARIAATPTAAVSFEVAVALMVMLISFVTESKPSWLQVRASKQHKDNALPLMRDRSSR
jgi:hypothetical protein